MARVCSSRYWSIQLFPRWWYSSVQNCADLLEDSHSWAVWSEDGNISGSPSGWSTRSLGDVVLLSAGLMAKVPALGLCAEETQRLAAGKFVFKRLDRSGAVDEVLHLEAVQSLQVGTAVARPSTGSPFAAGGVVVVEGQGDASASPWSSTEAHLESSAT